MAIRNMRLSFCLILALVALGCAVYYLIAWEVPVVLFFIPVGKITTENQPALFWSIVFAHAVVSLLGLVCGVRLARKR